jgi:hypothetical protein
MADINEVITLGIGTPSDIPHFVLVGLSPNPSGPSGGPDTDADGVGQPKSFSTSGELGGGSW